MNNRKYKKNHYQWEDDKNNSSEIKPIPSHSSIMNKLAAKGSDLSQTIVHNISKEANTARYGLSLVYNGLAFSFEAITEDAGIVLRNTLCGAALGTFYGSILGGFSEIHQICKLYGLKLKEIAEQIPGCVYSIDLPSDGTMLPNQKVFCQSNSTVLQALLSNMPTLKEVAANYSDTALQTAIYSLAGDAFRAEYTNGSDVSEALQVGLILGTTLGFASGLLHALYIKHAKEVKQVRISADDKSVDLTPSSLQTLGSRMNSLFRKIGSTTYPDGQVSGFFQSAALGTGGVLLAHSMKLNSGSNSLLTAASMLFGMTKFIMGIAITRPNTGPRMSTFWSLYGSFLTLLPAIFKDTLASETEKNIGTCLFTFGMLSLFSDLAKHCKHEFYIEEKPENSSLSARR